MNRQILIEENIGETRAAVVENGRIVELHQERWSEAGQGAIGGEIYRGRVRRVEPALNAAFVDLGVGPEGFLPFGKSGRPRGLHEGAALGVGQRFPHVVRQRGFPLWGAANVRPRDAHLAAGGHAPPRVRDGHVLDGGDGAGALGLGALERADHRRERRPPR